MLNVVCVHVGNYCDRGGEYVERLFNGIYRNLRRPFRPWCISDTPAGMITARCAKLGVMEIPADPGVNGWWNKVALFRPGIFPAGERVLYFDLDTVITGDLSDIASYQCKFAALGDFYFKGNLNSALMGWEAGALDHIWRVWDRCGRPQFDPGGDQSWIEAVQPTYDPWQEMFPGQIVSYKVDCQDGLPKDARVCCFHGRPRPHEVNFTIEPAYAEAG